MAQFIRKVCEGRRSKKRRHWLSKCPKVQKSELGGDALDLGGLWHRLFQSLVDVVQLYATKPGCRRHSGDILKRLVQRAQADFQMLGKVMTTVWDLPHLARRSITFDRGTKIAIWPHLQAEIDAQMWLCEPSRLWQKGTVKNTNRRVRRWPPRKRDIGAVSDHELKMIWVRLNATPGKCLGWKMPAEAFREKMLEEMQSRPYPYDKQESR